MKPEIKEIFLHTCSRLEIPTPKCEFKFHDKRQWKFDFAWPYKRVALEVEGGVWTKGRHTRPKGFMGDMEKYNAAAIKGWIVIRCSTDQLCKSKNLETIKKALNETNY